MVLHLLRVNHSPRVGRGDGGLNNDCSFSAVYFGWLAQLILRYRHAHALYRLCLACAPVGES